MKKNIARMLAALLCLACSNAFADGAPTGFDLTCDAYDLALHFTSPSHMQTDDDMVATIDFHGDTKDLHIPAGGYSTLIDNTTAQSGVCESDGVKVEAYRVSKDSFILFLAADRNPNIPDVVAFLIDTKDLTLSDVKNLGVSKDDDPAVIATPGGFKARLVIDQHMPGITCDCGASLLDAWMKIWVENGKIRTGWVRD
jgi:hypothetical protein